MQKHLFIALACLLASIAMAQNHLPKTVSGMVDINRVTDLTLDSLNKANSARPQAGSTRKGNNPVLFLIGNSTMRTGTLGNGNNGQWGWGFFIGSYFDENRITVENHALGGTSSRTFYNRLWPDVRKGIKRGDWVIIELGHNDNGPFDEGRARASIKGVGRDSLCVTIKETGAKETVYSYGEYMRRFIADIRATGAYPILSSLTPRNDWRSNGKRIVTKRGSFTTWIEKVCKEQNVPFIDLERRSANKFELFGAEKVNYMFYLDKIHTSEFGAQVNAQSAAEGIANCKGLELKKYLKPLHAPIIESGQRNKRKPVLFFTGDSTVKNADKEENGMWGLGSVAHCAFDTTKVTLVNCGIAGRSTRTYLDEGHWDRVYRSIRRGDYVFIQFGHNDIGDIEKNKARGVIRGTADTSHVYRMEATRQYKVVYSFGWYLRKFVGDVREKGGIPVLVSLTPRNRWKNEKIERRNSTYGVWMQEVAQQTGALYIDLHNLAADYLDEIGETAAAKYYNNDHTHTSKLGAELYAKLLVKGLKEVNAPLSKMARE